MVELEGCIVSAAGCASAEKSIRVVGSCGEGSRIGPHGLWGGVSMVVAMGLSSKMVVSHGFVIANIAS